MSDSIFSEYALLFKELSKPVIKQNIDIIKQFFKKACEYNHIFIIKLIIYLYNDLDYDVSRLCAKNGINSIKYLISSGIKIDLHYCIINAFNSKNMELFKYLMSLTNDFDIKNLYPYDIKSAKYLLSYDDYKINNNILEFVSFCCYIKLFKFLILVCKDKIDIHADNERILKNLFINTTNVEDIKYLFSLEKTYGKFNIHIDEEKIFRNACMYTNLDIVKYLISLKDTHGKIDIHVKNESAFISACENNKLDIVKYLISLKKEYGKIIILDDTFNGLIKTGNIKIIKYLLTLENEYGEFDLNYNIGYLHFLDDNDGKIEGVKMYNFLKQYIIKRNKKIFKNLISNHI